MNLTIDIGNSGIKIGVFNKGELIHFYHLKSAEKFPWKKFAIQKQVANVIICSVGKDSGNAIAANLKNTARVIYFNETTKIPIKNKYRTPKTLGKDRLAAAIGGANIFLKKNVLIIQAGTCLTFDFITAKNEYLGGAISPGLIMRLKALHTFTGKLPLVKPQNIAYRLGTTTDESILSGVVNGMKDEIEGAINDYSSRYKKIKVILTGGDAYFFESQLKNEIFAQPNLVLYGLNKIINHNV
jgi:type III pantothenate kinase